MISIIIPTFNSSQFIEDTLASIGSQTYTNWECILIDDGSSDTTITIIKESIKKDPRFCFFQRPTTLLKGANACRNYGFKKAKGTYIQFFDSDDIMLPNHLEDKIKVIQNTPGIEAIVNKISFYENDKITKETTIFSKTPLIDYYIGKITYYICGALWSKKILSKQSQLFDEEISNLDDWDFIIRMLLLKPKIKYLDSSTILYRQSPNSLSKQIELCNPQEIKSEILARFKILKIYKENNINTEEILVFLKNRFIQLYRISLEHKKYQIAKECYKAIKKVKVSVFIRVKIFIAFFTYYIFNKGYILLKPNKLK